MRALKMKIVTKYLKLWRTGWLLGFLFLMPFVLIAEIDEVQAQKLGNFLDNAFANMNEEEKQMFMEEVQREQQKLMAMSPEERAAREEQVAQELDQLINNSPYVEWFEKPAGLPTGSEPTPVVENAPVVNTPDETIVKKPTPNKSKPKTVIISKDLKNQYKQLIQNIVQAIDSVLLKTNNMQQIQHPSWNHGQWLNVHNDLQTLKSELQMVVNSDQTLGDLLSAEQTNLRDEIQIFEKMIVQKANELKTPDAMGLIVVFEGQPKIIDQVRYDSAVFKLKSIIDAISLPLTNLTTHIKTLLIKHTPADSRNNVDSKKLAATKKASTGVVESACRPGVDRDAALKKAQQLVNELKRCTNQQLFELVISYQKTPSTSLKRKLQWKLSELELHLNRLAKVVESLPKCKEEMQIVLESSDGHYELLHQIITALDNLQANQELSALIKQIKAHIVLLKL